MPGLRVPTNEVNMADVARHAGVSIATVSRALRDVPGVSEPTRERVRLIAEELAYVVSPEASGLARRETGRIAVVVPRIDIWFYASVLAGIEEVLRESDMDVLVYQVDGEAQRSRFFETLPARRKVDAVILVALPLRQVEVDRLDLLGVQIVVAAGRIGAHPHVEVDDYAVGRLAMAHLLDLGHTRIAMIRTSDTEGTVWSSDIRRCRGYRDALLGAGAGVVDDYLVTVAFGHEAGADAMAALLDLPEPPTAVFAYSDEIAVSALTTLLARGLRVPEDLSLIGVDGHPVAAMFGITSVHQAVELQGRLAASLTLGLVRDDQDQQHTISVPVELVVRASTGPPRAALR